MTSLNATIEGKNYVLSLPTSLSEISVDYLTELANCVNLPKYHCLVAIVYKQKLIELINMAKTKKETTSSVIPVLAKIGDTNKEEETITASIGDKLIITGTDLSRGIHVNIPGNVLSLSAVMGFISADKELLKKCMSLAVYNGEEPPYHYFVEFKIVPFNDIKGNFVDYIIPNNKFIKVVE